MTKIQNIVISIVIGLVLMISDYLITNIGYPLFDAIDVLALTEFYSKHTKKAIPYDPEDVVLLNVGYDKSVGYKTDDGDTLGTIDITDRSKLIRLLRIAKDADYKFLFLDVRFPQDIVTEFDTELYDLMSGMPRFLIAKHKDEDQADERLDKVSAYADYGSTLTSGFTRYELLQEYGASTALGMYRELDGGDIKRHGLFYTSGYSLCDNDMFVPIPSELVNSFDPSTPDEFMRLGSDLFSQNEEEEIIDSEIREMIRNKYVIVGDFDNDMHTTYAGDIPGSVITLLAYMNLKNENHKLNLWLWLLQWMVYVVMTYTIISTRSFMERFKDYLREKLNSVRERLKNIKIERLTLLTRLLNRLGNVKFGLLWFLMSFLTWSLMLLVLNVLYYILFTILITTFIPSLCFTIISQIKSTSEEAN